MQNKYWTRNSLTLFFFFYLQKARIYKIRYSRSNNNVDGGSWDANPVVISSRVRRVVMANSFFGKERLGGGISYGLNLLSCRWVGSQVLKGFFDEFWDWWWLRKVVTGGLETVLISDVGKCDVLAFRWDVREWSLSFLFNGKKNPCLVTALQ